MLNRTAARIDAYLAEHFSNQQLTLATIAIAGAISTLTFLTVASGAASTLTKAPLTSCFHSTLG